ncbi:MAG: cation transporter [Lachnospiraceae bacterium]|nr:cation transporter [Lachnospiraceae bacterium]
MYTILTHIFIKDYNCPDNPDVRKAYGTLSSGLGIFFNILLFAGKCLSGILSGSVSILADAFNNLSDAGSSIITYIGFRISGKEADADHPHGHGRIEYVTGFIVSLLILLVGLELFKSSLSQTLSPEPIELSNREIIILIASIIIKLYMFSYNFFTSKKIGSAAIKATAMDSLSDAVATTAVVISVILQRSTGIMLDGPAGLIVSLFILFSGFSAARETMGPLTGTSPSPELMEKIREIVNKCPEVQSMHDLFVHDYGPGHTLVSLHVIVPGDGNFREMHDAIDKVERELYDTLHCETVIHMDPSPKESGGADSLEKKVLSEVQSLDPRLTMHDFRLLKDESGNHIYFDVVIPPDFKHLPSETAQILYDRVIALGDYHAVIRVDVSAE